MKYDEISDTAVCIKLRQQVDWDVAMRDVGLNYNLLQFKNKFRINQVKEFNERYRKDYPVIITEKDLRFVINMMGGYPLKDVFLNQNGTSIGIDLILPSDKWHFRFEIRYDVAQILDDLMPLSKSYTVRIVELLGDRFGRILSIDEWEGMQIFRISRNFYKNLKHGL